MEDEAPYLRGGMDLLLINGWRAPLVSLLEKKGLKKKDSGYALLKGSGKESISVTFTVTGFQYDHGEQAPTESAYVLPNKNNKRNHLQGNKVRQNKRNRFCHKA